VRAEGGRGGAGAVGGGLFEEVKGGIVFSVGHVARLEARLLFLATT